MGRAWRFVLVAGLLLAFMPRAWAGPIASATWLQVIEGVPLTRTTLQLGATGGSSKAQSISVSLSYPPTKQSFFVPKTSMGIIDQHVTITQGGPQNITATPGMGGGTPGIPGSVIFMTVTHASMGVGQSMFMVGVNTLVRVPLSIGKAGRFTSTFAVLGHPHQITVDFYAWTPGTVSFTGLTSKGVALPTVIAMGSFGLKPGTRISSRYNGGPVTLVSPSKVSISGPGAIQRRTASFTTLKLTFHDDHYVPEPGTLLLLAAGAGALVCAARRVPR